MDVLKTAMTPTKPQREETYEQAKERLGLTEEDVIEGAASYRSYAIMFLIFGFVLFVYAFYLLFSGGVIAGFLLGLATAALCFGQAFKFDFWSFQMRQRKLGATFAEWKRNILGEEGSSK